MIGRILFAASMACLTTFTSEVTAQTASDIGFKTTEDVPYVLEIVGEPAHQAGLTRYLVSVRLPEGDRVSSIYGTNVHPMTLRAPEGVFNSPYNGSWSASGMNPKFFEIMPDMGDDTFATVGITTGAKISGVEGAEDPTMVQDPGAPWDAFFTEDGETDLAIDTHTGGAWFVLRTAANGEPVDGKVLLMHVTTAGSLSGAINVQIFPGTEDYDQLRCRFEFDGKGEFPGTIVE
ncbi:MAG: hypothetical protein ACPG66_07140 [Flavobacteriales bacterium]